MIHPIPAVIASIFLGLNLLPAAIQGAAAQNPDHFRHLEWEGKAYFSKVSNRFTHCAMTAIYESGTILGFAIFKSGLVVILGHPDWDLDSNTTYDARLAVDNRWAKKIKAYSRSGKGKGKSSKTDSVDIYLGNSREAFESLKHGRVLRVETQRKVLKYKLTGTLVALRKLGDCYVRQKKRQQDFASGRLSNPFAAAPKNSKRQSANPFSRRVSNSSARRPAPEPRKNSGKASGNVNEAAQWASRVSGVTSEIYSVLNLINDAEEIANAFIEKEISKKYAETRSVELLYQAQSKLASVEQSVHDLPNPPKYRDRPNFGSDTKRYILNLHGHIEKMLSDTKESVLAAFDGDLRTHSALTTKQFSNYIILLKTENLQIDLNNTKTDKYNPQIYLNKSAKFSNIVLIKIFTLFQAAVENDDLNLFSNFAVDSENALRRAIKSIETGRLATFRLKAIARSKGISNTRQIDAFIANLQMSFDNEEKITDVIRAMAQHLVDMISDPSKDDTETLIKRWQIIELELQRLAQLRTNFHNNRLKMIAAMDLQ